MTVGAGILGDGEVVREADPGRTQDERSRARHGGRRHGPKRHETAPHTYREGARRRRDHVEVCQIRYDSSKTTYEDLVSHLFTFLERGVEPPRKRLRVAVRVGDFCARRDATGERREGGAQSAGRAGRGHDQSVRGREPRAGVEDATTFYPARPPHQRYLEKETDYCNHRRRFRWEDVFVRRHLVRDRAQSVSYLFVVLLLIACRRRPSRRRALRPPPARETRAGSSAASAPARRSPEPAEGRRDVSARVYCVASSTPSDALTHVRAQSEKLAHPRTRRARSEASPRARLAEASAGAELGQRRRAPRPGRPKRRTPRPPQRGEHDLTRARGIRVRAVLSAATRARSASNAACSCARTDAPAPTSEASLDGARALRTRSARRAREKNEARQPRPLRFVVSVFADLSQPRVRRGDDKVK